MHSAIKIITSLKDITNMHFSTSWKKSTQTETINITTIYIPQLKLLLPPRILETSVSDFAQATDVRREQSESVGERDRECRQDRGPNQRLFAGLRGGQRRWTDVVVDPIHKSSINARPVKISINPLDFNRPLYRIRKNNEKIRKQKTAFRTILLY